MPINEIKSNADYRKATMEDGVVVIDAYASWCGPCKQIAPEVEKLSESYSKVQFYKFDIDEVPDVAHELGVSSVPNFSVFKDGMIHDGVNGANLKKLEDLVKEAGG